MRITEQGIEGAVQWTVILCAIVAGGLIIATVGNVVNQSLMTTGVL